MKPTSPNGLTLATTPAAPSPQWITPHPFVIRVGTGFVPYIYHPDRATPYLRVERFPRKAKLTPGAALSYAQRTIWYRQRRENEKRRRREAIDPRIARRQETAAISGRAA